MSKKYDLAVFIGRFQPIHKAHIACMLEALEHAEHLLVLVGSSNVSRSARNPFTYAERSKMVADALGPSYWSGKIAIAPLPDFPYNFDLWQENVQRAISTASDNLLAGHPKVAIIGHRKGEDSFWLDTFPQYDFIAATEVPGMNATNTRKNYFMCHASVPIDRIALETVPTVLPFLDEFRKTSTFGMLVAEHDEIRRYKQSWKAAPYEPVFVTTDAVVIKSGHIALIRRKGALGKGLLALPGGFIRPDQTLEDSALRELDEETKIPIPPAVLKGSIKATHSFSDPLRSLRGRTITHAFLIRLRDDGELPKLVGSDDAEWAGWVPLAELMPEQFFEDHYHIIQTMRGMAPKESL